MPGGLKPAIRSVSDRLGVHKSRTDLLLESRNQPAGGPLDSLSRLRTRASKRPWTFFDRGTPAPVNSCPAPAIVMLPSDFCRHNRAQSYRRENPPTRNAAKTATKLVARQQTLAVRSNGTARTFRPALAGALGTLKLAHEF
jgi:hypothetical protein